MNKGSLEMLKLAVSSIAFLAVGTLVASAQETTIIKERERPAVVVPLPGPPVIRERGPVVEKKTIETTGRGGCDTKTVHKEGVEGSTTVKKERCD
jgi:hypothetical protein